MAPKTGMPLTIFQALNNLVLSAPVARADSCKSQSVSIVMPIVRQKGGQNKSLLVAIGVKAAKRELINGCVQGGIKVLSSQFHQHMPNLNCHLVLDETKHHGASERPGKPLRAKSTRTNASSNTE